MSLRIVWNDGALLAMISEKGSALMQKVGVIVEQNCKDLCPVRTGKLQADITANVTDKEVSVGNTLDYALYVNLGTRKQQANPYLENGMLQSKAEIDQIGEV